MPRFKHYNYDQSAMVVINYQEQLQPGTIEHTVHYLIEHKLDQRVPVRSGHHDLCLSSREILALRGHESRSERYVSGPFTGPVTPVSAVFQETPMHAEPEFCESLQRQRTPSLLQPGVKALAHLHRLDEATRRQLSRQRDIQ